MSWGDAQEQRAIRRTMKEAATALINDQDWFGPLMECHSEPQEGYLHTILATGEVLPFSLALAVVYKYPCTLGQQQPDLHERLVYSSIYWIPLNVRAEPKESASNIDESAPAGQPKRGGRVVGYVSDTYTDGSTHRDEVCNRWRGEGFHYECHHDECYVTATARMYFMSEEEYLVH